MATARRETRRGEDRTDSRERLTARDRFCKGDILKDHETQESRPRRDALADLEARIDAAIEEVRPKLKKAFEELDARVDSAIQDLKPRVDEAMDDVRPRVDRFVTDIQPRLDGVLQKVQAKIAELRTELEERAHRSSAEPLATLPRPSDGTEPSGTPGATDGQDAGTGPGGTPG